VRIPQAEKYSECKLVANTAASAGAAACYYLAASPAAIVACEASVVAWRGAAEYFCERDKNDDDYLCNYPG
jgi:hypothetical protein